MPSISRAGQTFSSATGWQESPSALQSQPVDCLPQTTLSENKVHIPTPETEGEAILYMAASVPKGARPGERGPEIRRLCIEAAGMRTGQPSAFVRVGGH